MSATLSAMIRPVHPLLIPPRHRQHAAGRSEGRPYSSFPPRVEARPPSPYTDHRVPISGVFMAAEEDKGADKNRKPEEASSGPITPAPATPIPVTPVAPPAAAPGWVVPPNLRRAPLVPGTTPAPRPAAAPAPRPPAAPPPAPPPAAAPLA